MLNYFKAYLNLNNPKHRCYLDILSLGIVLGADYKKSAKKIFGWKSAINLD